MINVRESDSMPNGFLAAEPFSKANASTSRMKTLSTAPIIPPPFFRATSLTEISACHEITTVSQFPKMRQECE